MSEPLTSQRPGTRPASPCVNICTLDEGDICTGCLRSLDEIATWATLSAEDQWRVVEALPARAAVRRASR